MIAVKSRRGSVDVDLRDLKRIAVRLPREDECAHTRPTADLNAVLDDSTWPSSPTFL